MARTKEAKAAYQAAVAEIAAAKKDGRTTLDFNKDQFRALDTLPAGIGDLTTVTRLILWRTHVIDLTPLAEMFWLTSLDLMGTPVSELVPLTTMTGLTTLDLRDTSVSDLAPLAAMRGLTELYLNRTRVTDLGPLAAMTWLIDLSLNFTQVSDLSPLAQMTGLFSLSLRRTQVEDIAQLAVMNLLHSLDLRGTLVNDLRPIRDLPLTGGRSLFAVGLAFDDTPAAEKDPELARLAAIEDNADRTAQTLAYLKTLPPWPEPYSPVTIRNDTLPEPIGQESNSIAPLVASPVPGRGLVAPVGLRRLSIVDARAILENGHPLLRDRCQRVVAEIDDAMALLNLRIPNEPDLLAEHDVIVRTFTISKAALMGIHDAIPADLSDQPIDEADAGRLRAAFDAALEMLKQAATYVDRQDHTPTYGGLLKLGTATGLASVLAFVPGVNLALAIPAVYACLYGTDAAKALKDIGKLGGSDAP